MSCDDVMGQSQGPEVRQRSWSTKPTAFQLSEFGQVDFCEPSYAVCWEDSLVSWHTEETLGNQFSDY